VSFRGNGEETWHLAPSASITVLDTEVTNNSKIQKLEAIGAIAVQAAAAVVSDPPEGQRPRATRSRRSEKP
jgi:hypothetical protein